MLKDLGLAHDAAQAAGVDVPLGAFSQEIYKTICDAGLDKKDFGSIFKYLSEGGVITPRK